MSKAARSAGSAGSTAAGWLEPVPVRRLERRRPLDADDEEGLSVLEPGAWPLTLAPVRQLLAEGLDLGRATVLVGANGSGKSTIIEAVAMAFGLAAEGGSTGARHRTYESESQLHRELDIVRGAGASKWGYFVRAETMHGLMGYLDETARDVVTLDPAFARLSHGESFLALLSTSRFRGPGFFVMDEPEAGLAFEAQLALVGELTRLSRRKGCQVLVATHSPIVAALPGARILQLDEHGIHAVEWADLETVGHFRRFLAAPQQYLRHLD
ncbi:MAG TPA: AAA family ATPase [Dermatophilaceae bacterium]|jgi:predicted ATPase|nr:AAA family ATPase [Dermatophilaceae bacterium]HMT88607.1 AAA family ATPase [Dermatophilaceae bacterium]